MIIAGSYKLFIDHMPNHLWIKIKFFFQVYYSRNPQM